MLCKIDDECKIDYSVTSEDAYAWRAFSCWTISEVGPDDSKTSIALGLKLFRNMSGSQSKKLVKHIAV